MTAWFPVNYPEMIVEKSEGVTLSEKKLQALGYNTFLSLWSYPNPFKKQAGGKELCDLLVVFEDHIIIFSDKDCAYGESDDPRIAWRRWYKKAIKRSVEQLLGAKSWIKNNPTGITLDAKCEKPFPLEITITENTKFHLIAVAHGASEACVQHFSGGDGGLIIDSHVIGKMHDAEDCDPFYVGLVEEGTESFVHVFDDASYAIVLQELDTILDFVEYLDARKTLLTSKYVCVTSERELLAQYLAGIIKGSNKTLEENLCGNCDCICIQEGHWDSLVSSSEYAEWKKKLQVSYFWDGLLQKTFFYIENGLSERTNEPTIQNQSKVFCRLARENRVNRMALSDGFLSFLNGMPKGFRGTRVLWSEREPDICYVLLLLPKPEGATDKEYRDVRARMICEYCMIAKTDFPEVTQVVGVAHESSEEDGSSEDFVLLDASAWTDEEQEEALRLKKEYQEMGCLGERKYITKTYMGQAQNVKGRDRNKPCPCGSGLKYKKCCGRNN